MLAKFIWMYRTEHAINDVRKLLQILRHAPEHMLDALLRRKQPESEQQEFTFD